ncbi:MAG: hypothetical protein MUC88_08750 [Planctomycetes bacterium]|jgi:hypothetical protein|nr:hypothetical protein [Planctomycetota bacterium]
MIDLRPQLSRGPTDGRASIAIVDIDQNPERTLAELSKLTALHARTWFIVLAEEFNERRVLHAMQMGARHFLRKGAIATELDPVLERLLAQRPQASTRLGLILSRFSCSGGCGVTTAAVNLGNELRLARDQRVLIMDLDPHYGTAATYPGVAGRYGIGHVLSREGPIDGHLIVRQLMVRDVAFASALVSFLVDQGTPPGLHPVGGQPRSSTGTAVAAGRQPASHRSIRAAPHSQRLGHRLSQCQPGSAAVRRDGPVPPAA